MVYYLDFKVYVGLTYLSSFTICFVGFNSFYSVLYCLIGPNLWYSEFELTFLFLLDESSPTVEPEAHDCCMKMLLAMAAFDLDWAGVLKIYSFWIKAVSLMRIVDWVFWCVSIVICSLQKISLLFSKIYVSISTFVFLSSSGESLASSDDRELGYA